MQDEATSRSVPGQGTPPSTSPAGGRGPRTTRRGTLIAIGGVAAAGIAATAVGGTRRHPTATPEAAAETPIMDGNGPVGQGWTFISRPDLTPPVMTQPHGPLPTGATLNSAEGNLIALGPKDPDIHPSMQGNLLCTPAGDPVWVMPTPQGTFDVRVQKYEGKPVLTFWEGTSNQSGTGTGLVRLLDENYDTVTTVTTGGDIGKGHADIHETRIMSDGTIWLIAFITSKADLRPLGGQKAGWVLEGVVQEVDIKTGAVKFEWHSLDHVPVAESYQAFDPSTMGTKDAPFDYIHLNSIDPDADTVMISSRHTHTVYLLDRATGKIQWRFGGKHSDFTMPTTFAWQHDALRHSDGTLTLFDNASSPAVEPTSRGLRFRLDTSAMTATLVQQYLPPTKRLAFSQGNVQVLDNGHVIVGWGQLPYVTEYDADGTVLGELNFAPGTSYRAYRVDWHATPKRPPDVVVKRVGTMATVYVSWNGATDVSMWQVLSGATHSDMGLNATAEKAGFETSIQVADLGNYVEVRAIDADGKIIGVRHLNLTKLT